MAIQTLVWYADDSTAATIRQWIWRDVAYDGRDSLEKNFSEYYSIVVVKIFESV